MKTKEKTDKARKSAENTVKHYGTRLWLRADGEELPPYEKEVAVMATYPEGGEYIALGHRPDPNGPAARFGKGGWNYEGIQWWLMQDLPDAAQESAE